MCAVGDNGSTKYEQNLLIFRFSTFRFDIFYDAFNFSPPALCGRLHLKPAVYFRMFFAFYIRISLLKFFSDQINKFYYSFLSQNHEFFSFDDAIPGNSFKFYQWDEVQSN